MHAREESKVLEDQCMIMSLNATLILCSRRSAPTRRYLLLRFIYRHAITRQWKTTGVEGPAGFIGAEEGAIEWLRKP